jgi:hypothetical protein
MVDNALSNILNGLNTNNVLNNADVNVSGGEGYGAGTGGSHHGGVSGYPHGGSSEGKKSRFFNLNSCTQFLIFKFIIGGSC